MAENQNDAVQHGLNAAKASAEDAEQQQQVEQLSSLLQNNAENANATSSAVNENESDLSE
ncbi:hypothetical protein N0M98_09725 [Paenibacillus doosanensis]|uniref:Uncharacterized protein n=1 Tax=Paenibacillus konkukensis TaxID=2020716 RepID=A0ABY4RXN4_9BACL|nr:MULTISPECIES: hypothetical protein [Paenibacillus]MCS7460419.1 hypothetical protein [Paenibacillus doosanensis]UQZ87444.1 hypothetical protein SK3146_06746 [Paenibacillus konkukensis]